MDVARVFASAVVRKIAYILTALAVYALLSLVGIGKAHADTYTRACNSNNPVTCSREQAYAACETEKIHMGQSAHYPGAIITCPHQSTWPRYACEMLKGTNTQLGAGLIYACTGGSFYYVAPNGGCPTGKTWDDTTNTCKLVCTNGYNAGSSLFAGESADVCNDQGKCSARNSSSGFADIGAEETRGYTNLCIAGCTFKQNGAGTSIIIGSATAGSGKFEFDGTSCGWTAPPHNAKKDEGSGPRPPKPQECIPSGAQTSCLKPNGQHCYSASTGRQICWTPGETGEKTDGNTIQTREPGATDGTTPPSTLPPPGESYTAPQPPRTVTTTTNGVNIVTTTTNRTTTNGTNAGGTAPPAGEPGTGEGEGEGEEGSASGGGDCAAPPSGAGDPILHKIAEMAWRLRCAGSETGMPDASVAGDQGTDAHPDKESVITDGNIAEQIAAGGDDTGFLSNRTCPLLDVEELSVMGYNIPLPWGTICTIMQIIGAIVLLAGHIQWAFIVARVGT